MAVIRLEPEASNKVLTTVRRQVDDDLEIVGGRFTAILDWAPSNHTVLPGEMFWPIDAERDPYVLPYMGASNDLAVLAVPGAVSLVGAGAPSPPVALVKEGERYDLTIHLDSSLAQTWRELASNRQLGTLMGGLSVAIAAPSFDTEDGYRFPGYSGTIDVPLGRLFGSYQDPDLQCDLREEVLDGRFEHRITVQPCAVVSATQGVWESPGLPDEIIQFGSEGGERPIKGPCEDPRTFSAFVRLVTSWSVPGAKSLITERRLSSSHEPPTTSVVVKPTAHCPKYTVRVFALENGNSVPITSGHVLWSFRADWLVTAPSIYSDLAGDPPRATESLPTLTEVPEAIVTAVVTVLCNGNSLSREFTMPASKTADVVFDL
jgi:hypothetical protein